MLTLLVLQGPDKGRRFELPDEQIVIGRDSSQLPLTDNTVSRRHVDISLKDGIHLLTDLGSANGTFINGSRVRSPQAIRVGDQLRVGRTLMVFGSQPGFRGAVDGEVEMAGAESGMDSAIMHTVSSSEDSLILAVPDPAAAAVSNLQILYQLGAALGSSFDVSQAMAITMDLVFEHVKAERGMVLLKDEVTGDLTPVVVRTRDQKRAAPGAATEGGGTDAAAPKIQASRTIIDHVMRSGEGVLSSNAMADRRFSKGKSVHDLGIRSALCVPIKAKHLGRPPPSAKSASDQVVAAGGAGGRGGDVIGIIYIDSSVRNYTYSPDQLRLLGAIGLQAGMAVQNAMLYQVGIRAERLAAIGETTAALSHSIKNILQALRGGADVVEMGLAGSNLPQAAKGWTIVNRNLDRIFSLTMNLLAYSRPRTAGAEGVNPGAIVTDVVELVARSASERGVMVVADTSAEHPPCPLDAEGIHQVLMNLVGNAVDAAPTGTGLVKVASRYDAAGDVAVIEVTDNGPGIPATMKRHLFELFHSTKGNRGTGLGLAVSRKIVEEHEGAIGADSTESGGTVFTVRLPMRRLTETDDPAE